MPGGKGCTGVVGNRVRLLGWAVKEELECWAEGLKPDAV